MGTFDYLFTQCRGGSPIIIKNDGGGLIIIISFYYRALESSHEILFVSYACYIFRTVICITVYEKINSYTIFETEVLIPH